MSIYKDNVTGKWRVVYRYTDWTGKTKQTSKRGFPTKREAQMWEHEQMLKHDAKLDMTFASFYEIYVEDKKERIRDNTWGTKNNIARTKILPYFGERKIAEIEPKDVIAWQNHLLAFKRANGKGYSASYLRKIHSQLSAIFNHAVDFYHLLSNPAQKAGNIAIEEYKEMLFWTKEEYLKFADVMMDKPVSYYAFEMLYWCGIREGELLALTPADFDFTTHTLRINKSYQRLNREDVITPPKTFKSNRSWLAAPQRITSACTPSTPTSPYITLWNVWKISAMKICCIRSLSPPDGNNTLLKACGYSASPRASYTPTWIIYPVI